MFPNGPPECGTQSLPVPSVQTRTELEYGQCGQEYREYREYRATSPEALNCHVAIEPSRMSIASVPLERIIPDPHQPRKEFDSQGMDRLAASIKKCGLKIPVRVRWMESKGKYMILTGERRFRAATQAGLPAIDCIIAEGGLTEAERLEEQLTENLMRQDLNPMEKARGMGALMEAQKWSQKQLADNLHLATSDVTRLLALLGLPENVQELVRSGIIAARTAYEVTKLRTPEDQVELVNLVVKEGLDVKATEELVRLQREKLPRHLQAPIDPTHKPGKSGRWITTPDARNRLLIPYQFSLISTTIRLGTLLPCSGRIGRK